MHLATGVLGKQPARMETCMNKDEAFIRQCAGRNLSKSHTAQLLGFWPSVFPDYLKVLGLEDIEWCEPHKSLLAQQQRRDLHDSRRGIPQSQENRERLLRCAALHHPKYTAFGVTDTLGALVNRFGAVHKNTVVHRINKLGMTLEQALICPAGIPKARRQPESHPWRQSERNSFTNYKDRLGRSATMEAS